jgi:hypothetical protein
MAGLLVREHSGLLILRSKSVLDVGVRAFFFTKLGLFH